MLNSPPCAPGDQGGGGPGAVREGGGEHCAGPRAAHPEGAGGSPCPGHAADQHPPTRSAKQSPPLMTLGGHGDTLGAISESVKFRIFFLQLILGSHFEPLFEAKGPVVVVEGVAQTPMFHTNSHLRTS